MGIAVIIFLFGMMAYFALIGLFNQQIQLYYDKEMITAAIILIAISICIVAACSYTTLGGVDIYD